MGFEGKLRTVEGGLAAYCPGCQSYHLFDSRWIFNGNHTAPTFTPSMLVNANQPASRCHSFVQDGSWRFLDDCFHELKGQTVPMEDED